MKRFYSMLLFFILHTASAQLYFGNQVEISLGATDSIYTNSNLVNESVLHLKNDSHLIVDADFTNNATIHFQNGIDKAIFQIGSGTSRSNQVQSIQFHPSFTEEIPFLILHKNSQIASITRGHLRLLERLKSISGNLDAQSSIDASNISSGLTFISPDATTTAVVEESVSGDIQNVIVERFIPNSNRAFRYLASSVTTNEAIRENLQEGVNSANPSSIIDPHPGYGTQITGSQTGVNGFDATPTGNPSFFFWNGASQEWNATPNTDSRILNVGEAYSILVRGDRNLNLSIDNLQFGEDTTLRTIGELIVGDYPVGNLGKNTGDYSLIGNPYQAQVDLEELLTSADNVGLNSNYIYYYDPTLFDRGGYVTLDFSDLSITPVDSDADQYLQPNQSFFVETESPNPSLTFKESYKKATEQTFTNDVFTVDANLKIYINLFDIDANVNKDAIRLQYGSSFSDEVSSEDGVKFWNTDESLAILNEANYLVIDKRNSTSQYDSAQLYLWNYRNQNYSFQIGIENPPQGEILLIDHYLGSETPLTEFENTYAFSVDQSIPASVSATRFELNFEETNLGVSIQNSSDLSVYPNPASTQTTIDLSSITEEIDQLQIFDVSGKLVKSFPILEAKKLSIDVANYPRGMYILEIQCKTTTYNKKLILK